MIRYAWRNQKGLYYNGKDWQSVLENSLFTDGAASSLLPGVIERHNLCAVPVNTKTMLPVWNEQFIVNEIYRQRACRVRAQGTQDFKLVLDDHKYKVLKAAYSCRECLLFAPDFKTINGMPFEVVDGDVLLVLPRDLLPD